MATRKQRSISERRWAAQTLWLFAVCATSGGLTWLSAQFAVWLQLLWLLHVISGLLLMPTVAFYLVRHIRRTWALRRWSVIASGILASVIGSLLAISGLWLAVVGTRERNAWINDLHEWAAAVAVGVLLCHLLAHIRGAPQSQRALYEGRRSLLGPREAARAGLITAALLLLVSAVHVFYPESETRYTTEPVVADYQYPYGEHPFWPSQTETWHGAFVDLRQIDDAAECGACHTDIYRQWQSSIHRHAASDKTYVTNISLLADNKGIAATRYCEGCHAPIALLTGELSEGGQHGGIEGTPANAEGVNCLSCHGITRPVHLKGVASYEFAAARDYLGGHSRQPLQAALNRYLIALNPTQHKRDMGRDVLGSPKLCATCHVQFMDKEMNGWGWVKMQDEYNAWLQSPYSRQHDQEFANASVVRCQDCHMPLVPAEDPSADANGLVRSHRFAAANTVVPLLNGDTEQLRLIKAFLQQDKMRLVFDEPRRADATQTLMAVDEALRPELETPYFVYLNEDLNLTLVVSNTGVGHNFPGGTIDINQAWLEVVAVDGGGDVLFESGRIDDKGYVDESAIFYRSLPVDRHGNLVWKHDLFNRIGQTYRRVIEAGKSDVVSYTLTIPGWAKSPLTVNAKLRYRKLNTRYAKWALKEQYQPIPVIDVARTSIVIPIKTKPPVSL